MVSSDVIARQAAAATAAASMQERSRGNFEAAEASLRN